LITTSLEKEYYYRDHLNNKPYGAWNAIDIAKDFNTVLGETTSALFARASVTILA
jgi:hypothetical protein